MRLLSSSLVVLDNPSSLHVCSVYLLLSAIHWSLCSLMYACHWLCPAIATIWPGCVCSSGSRDSQFLNCKFKLSFLSLVLVSRRREKRKSNCIHTYKTLENTFTSTFVTGIPLKNLCMFAKYPEKSLDK